MGIFESFFEEGWYSRLEHYLTTPEFLEIAKNINKDRTNNIIIPQKGSKLFLKVFREVPFNGVCINVLGQDPYHGEGQFDGLAFSNSTLERPQPSLANILEEVENDIYEGLNLKRVTNYSLYDWAKQGVFLNNTAHTVIKGEPESHLKYWKDFTIEVMKALNNKDNIVHLLWGRKAQKYKKYITNPTHKIIETSHPSPLGCFNKAPIPFVDSGCFSKANQYLKEINLKEIRW